MNKKLTAVFIRNRKALDLLAKRAVAENRSAANAAETTIVESLSERYGKQDTTYTENQQAKMQ